MTQATVQVQITPKMMAQAFWSMDSELQTEFFNELASVISQDHESGNTSAYSLGELQWFYVGHELLKPSNKQAKDMLMKMAAPMYLHTLRYVEGF